MISGTVETEKRHMHGDAANNWIEGRKWPSHGTIVKKKDNALQMRDALVQFQLVPPGEHAKTKSRVFFEQKTEKTENSKSLFVSLFNSPFQKPDQKNEKIVKL